MKKLSQVDDSGRVKMIDVGGKPPQRRTARASGRIRLLESTVSLIRENRIEKGDVLTVAQIAGIQAAKKTAEIIPLCHPLVLDRIDVTMTIADDGVTAESEIGCVGRTGVEMEALTAVSAALLTVYDMCKSVDQDMCIGEIRLLEKRKE